MPASAANSPPLRTVRGSPFDRAGLFQEGEAAGELKATRGALRRILARRGIELRREDSARIDACADLATLERWLEEAAVAERAEEALR